MAKTDIETLVISLEARVSSYERSLKKAQETTNRHLKAIEDRATKAGGGISKGLTNSLKQAELQAATSGAAISAALSRGLKGAGAAVITNEVRKMGDAWQEAANKIRSAGAGGTALDQVVDIAQRARTELAPTVDLYARLTRSSAELGASQAEVAVATEAVAKSLKISGASAQETSGTLVQLSQALQSGRLQGDELRSLLENAPVLVRSIAKEFGVAVGELKTLGSEGRLVSDRVFKALVNSAEEVNAAFAKTSPTNQDYWTNLQTAATQYVGQSGAVAGATSLINSGIEGLTNNFALLGDGAIALGAILAARLVAAGLKPLALQIGMVATQFMAAPAAIAATNAALAATAGRATAAAVAARVLSGSLALIGGVPGAIILGIGGAAIYAASQMKEGEARAKEYADALERVRQKGEGVEKAVTATGDAVILAARQQQDAELAEIGKNTEQAQKDLQGVNKELDEIQNKLKGIARTPVKIAPEIASENLQKYGVVSREEAEWQDSEKMLSLTGERDSMTRRLDNLQSEIKRAATSWARSGFEEEIEKTKKRIAELEDQITNFKPNPAIEALAPTTFALNTAAEKAGKLVEQFRSGAITAEKLQLELMDIQKTSPVFKSVSDEAKTLADRIASIIARLEELGTAREKASKIVSDAEESRYKADIDRQGRIVGSTPEFRSLRESSFENAQVEEARKSAEAKELEAEAQRILNEAKKKGIEYTEQQAAALAKQVIEQRRLAKDAGSPTGILSSRLAPGRDIEHVERLSSSFAGKLSKMLSEMPDQLRDQVRITSGYRSPERQQQLWLEAVRKYGSEDAARKWVAPPGRSQHNKGNAADLSYGGSTEARQWMHSNARKYGLTFPLSNENWHIEDLDARRSQVDQERDETLQREVKLIEEATKKREEREKAYKDINAEADRYIERQNLEAAAVGKTELQVRAAAHTFELLNEAKRAGIEITPQLKSEYEELGQKMAQADVNADSLRKRFDELNDTAAFFGGEAVDALSGLITGTTTAEQALQSLIQTLVRATLQAALLGEGPLASLFGGSGGGLTKGLGGLLGNLFGGTSASVHHAGGIAGAGGISRTVPAAFFAGAPRYHNGGIAGLKPDEIPAILQRGEGVVSRVNMMAAAVAGRGGGGRAPTVNVNNFGPTTPEVQVSRSGDGYSIDVLIPGVENAMAARASRGHGSLGKAVTSAASGRNLRG